MNVEKFVAGLHEYLEKQFAPLVQRLSQLESRPLEKGDTGERGEKGEKGEKGDQGEQGPPGNNGLNGKDGKNGAPGERGETGQPGRDGIDGKDGRDGIDGKDGAPGPRGEKGERGNDGINGKDGRDGIDGKSITIEDVQPLFDQAFAKWALDFERRAQDAHVRLLTSFDKPRDGTNGKDGADGLGFEDMEEVFDGERTVTRRYRKGDRLIEFHHKFPVILDRGVYQVGRHYEKGDTVTYQGSLFICQLDTNDKPETSKSWRLAVKRGRDGKDKA